MNKYLLLRLVIPLLLLTVIAAITNYFIKYDGFFINLTTELISIIITVIYVNVLLNKHESRLWFGTKTRINNKLEIIVNSTLSGIRSSLGFNYRALEDFFKLSDDMSKKHKGIKDFSIKVILPIVRERIDNLDAKGWKNLSNHIKSIWSEYDHLLNLFINRLNPKQIELIMDIQNATLKSLTFYTTFPDVAGIPDELAPKGRTPIHILKRDGYNATADAIKNIIIYSCKITDS